jgi:hypothetical protein
MNESNEELQKQFSGVKTTPKWIVILFFILGLVSSVAFRAIIVFQRVRADWVRPVWYFGVTGFVAFFFYSFVVNRKRKKLIAESPASGETEVRRVPYAEDAKPRSNLIKVARRLIESL